MNPLTREWVRKAEGDFRTARREWRSRVEPNYDALCFHAQQCIEKYLKARLQESNIPFERTHNLQALLDAVVTVEPLWDSFRTQMIVLNQFSVTFRYPGESANKAIAAEAMGICKSLRKTIREKLRLV